VAAAIDILRISKVIHGLYLSKVHIDLGTADPTCKRENAFIWDLASISTNCFTGLHPGLQGPACNRDPASIRGLWNTKFVESSIKLNALIVWFSLHGTQALKS